MAHSYRLSQEMRCLREFYPAIRYILDKRFLEKSCGGQGTVEHM